MTGPEIPAPSCIPGVSRNGELTGQQQVVYIAACHSGRSAGQASRAAERVDRQPKRDRGLAALVELLRLQAATEAAVREQLLALRADGVPASVIAERLGVTRQAVNRRLRAAERRAEGTDRSATLTTGGTSSGTAARSRPAGTAGEALAGHVPRRRPGGDAVLRPQGRRGSVPGDRRLEQLRGEYIDRSDRRTVAQYAREYAATRLHGPRTTSGWTP